MLLILLLTLAIQQHLLTIREAAWLIISVDSVCMYMSLCQMITFESLDEGSSSGIAPGSTDQIHI